MERLLFEDWRFIVAARLYKVGYRRQIDFFYLTDFRFGIGPWCRHPDNRIVCDEWDLKGKLEKRVLGIFAARCDLPS